ncbi:MAG: UDP-2,3-diacylglucosamine diphosphatase [Thiomargarita sp.]|nr:UDP-2,3-diacylglucosamine diphosphatase [Thiomargarita sp.]
MSETLFIADLHLTPTQPLMYHRFLSFLDTRVRKSDALYILGDLFDVWLGDDDDDPVYQKIKSALYEITRCGVPIFIMRGNRDFLLGIDFAQTTACQLIDDPSVITVYGTKYVLTHGDTLCTEDTRYLDFRQRVHLPWLQKLFLLQPLFLRRFLARKIRANSQIKTQTTAKTIMDVTSEGVSSVLETQNAYHLIHGHTHQPAIHRLTVNGQTAYRFVVGDWREDSAIILSCTHDGCQLIDL